jgi:hypothetical protein
MFRPLVGSGRGDEDKSGRRRRPLRNGGFVSPDKAAAQRIAELVKENETLQANQTLQAKSTQESEAMSGWFNDVIFFGLHNQLLKCLARNEPQITDRYHQWCEPCWGYQFQAAAQRIAELVKENQTLQAKSDQESEAQTEAGTEAKSEAK